MKWLKYLHSLQSANYNLNFVRGRGSYAPVFYEKSFWKNISKTKRSVPQNVVQLLQNAYVAKAMCVDIYATVSFDWSDDACSFLVDIECVSFFVNIRS